MKWSSLKQNNKVETGVRSPSVRDAGTDETMEIEMLYVDDVMAILEIDNDWVARCILAKMVLPQPDDAAFIAECKRAAEEFLDECANATQGS